MKQEPQAAEPMRPGLLFTAARLDRLRARIAANPAVRARWERARARAVDMLDVAWIVEAQAAQGAGQHADYPRAAHQLADAVPLLALAFHLEGDLRFAAKIREGLLHYAGYRLWSGPMHWP